MYEGQSSFLPLKLNTSGVIPPIFASSLLLPAGDHGELLGGGRRAAGILGTLNAYLAHGRPLYMFLYAR
jgi:preprotein translocase subunit SecY